MSACHGDPQEGDARGSQAAHSDDLCPQGFVVPRGLLQVVMDGHAHSLVQRAGNQAQPVTPQGLAAQLLCGLQACQVVWHLLI